MRIINLCNKVIEYSFYAIFLLVPLTFASDTFELFEFNKMWLTFALAIIIGAAWVVKMVLQGRMLIQRTPLDIPIILFLLSQIISTIFSWDQHISIWGYYSRFNGGLLSIISYIFIYYAFVSNLAAASMVKRMLFVSLISGLIVTLWGLPSHFGYDPTCFLFRGTLDVSCWTADFQPKVRIFSTLGQPDWLAAYLAILLPISIIMFIKSIKNLPLSTFYLLLSALFYLALLYTAARSGLLAAWLSIAFFFIVYFWIQRKKLFHPPTGGSNSLVVFVVFFSITFFVGQPFPQLDKFTFNGIKASLSNPITNNKQPITNKPHAGEFGGTDSGKIRLLVWQGAVDTWRHYPIFGTGVETFAFAYYRFRPQAHNLTSEWNFLYNKAHNEFLNYLATTGTVGLGSYLLMICAFLIRVMLNLFQDLNSRKTEMLKLVQHDKEKRLLIIALLASYFSILITNFFGFSVVLTNIYLFMIPAFVFILGGMIDLKKQFIFPKTESVRQPTDRISLYQWTLIFFTIIISCFLLLNLFKFWNADKAYSLGYNLDRAGEYQQAYTHLQKALDLRDGEPVFKDELSINNAVLAGALLTQKDTKTSTDSAMLANTLAHDAISLSNSITSKYPNNVVFWKNRVRVFYSLGQVDSRYLSMALGAIKSASELSPTDANISYNLGILYGQNNETKKAIEVLEQTKRLKPDYRDAYYALGLFYHDTSIDKDGKVINSALQKMAVAQMKYILTHIASDDAAVKEILKTWEKE